MSLAVMWLRPYTPNVQQLADGDAEANPIRERRVALMESCPHGERHLFMLVIMS